MPTKKPSKKASPRRRRAEVATPEDAIARGIRDARRRRGWTQQDLADRLAEVGYPLDRSTLAKLEATKKARGISVNDAIAIAAALGIAPVHLFTGLGEDEIAIGEKLTAEAWRVRSWMRGRAGPLPDAPGDAEVERRVYFDLIPPREKELQNEQIFADAELLGFNVLEALGWKGSPVGVPDWLIASIKNTAEDLQRNVRKFTREIQRFHESGDFQDIRP